MGNPQALASKQIAGFAQIQISADWVAISMARSRCLDRVKAKPAVGYQCLMREKITVDEADDGVAKACDRSGVGNQGCVKRL